MLQKFKYKEKILKDVTSLFNKIKGLGKEMKVYKDISVCLLYLKDRLSRINDNKMKKVLK